jgi:hypothetical protein
MNNSGRLLNRFAYNRTSQHGEDGILAYIVERLRDRVVPVCCEFGAADGIYASNTYSLWSSRGWQGVLIEGAPEFFGALNNLQKEFPSLKVLKTFVSVAGDSSLDALFVRHNLPHEIGVLSIDIDSVDYHVWAGIEKVRAQVVVIEFNQYIPPFVDYVDPPGHVYLGCSLKALERLGEKKGYRLICATNTNAIMVADELHNPADFPDLPAEALFQWKTLAPSLVKFWATNNSYPIWSAKQRRAYKVWNKIYFRASSLTHSKKRWRAPPEEVRAALRRAGLDF